MTHGTGSLERMKTLVAQWVPFAPLSDHRRVQRFARKQGYRIADVLAWGRTYLVEKDGTPYLLKRCGDNGLLVQRDVLPRIGGNFRRLVIPRLVRCGCDRRLGSWILTEWLPGRGFQDRWDELDPQTCGGRAIGLEYVDVVLDVLEELRGTDAEAAARAGLECRNQAFLRPRITAQLDKALARGLLSHEQQRRALGLLEPFLQSVEEGPLRLSNHDFNFRNLVELPGGRIALVDWDAARVSTYETEHCVTYLGMLMWNHPQWVDALFDRARTRFGLDRRRMRAALLINALNQSMHVWPERPELFPIPLATFLRTLDAEPC